MKCTLAEPITKMIDMIFEKINRTFDVSDVTKDLLKSIAALFSLSDNSLYTSMWLIISHDLAAATATTPYSPDNIH